MIRYFARLSLIVLALSWTVASHGQSSEWYGAGSIIYNNDDPYRAIDDSLSGIQVNVGRNMTDHLSLEGILGYSDISAEPCAPLDCFPDQGQLDIGANLLAYYNRDSIFAPYLLAGVGYLNVSLDPSSGFPISRDSGDSAATATLGLGVKWRLGQSNFSIRAEHRARTAFDDENLTDQVTTIGIQFGFGGKAHSVGVPDTQLPTDTDGDGVLDMWDDCPDTPSGVDVTARGCEIQNIDRDSDNDRVPDSRDQCPNTQPGAPVDLNGCSLDSDMDGVTTDRDRCPASRPGADVDEFGCENDEDLDGIVDHRDECPNTRSNARVDDKGCEIRDVISLPGVNFRSGSDLLLAGAENLIQEIATTLNANEYLQIEVAGHTDSQGNETDNQGLSDRRAKTVYDFLVRYGVDESRLTFRGYGESQPIADNATSEGRATNRRVELRVVRR